MKAENIRRGSLYHAYVRGKVRIVRVEGRIPYRPEGEGRPDEWSWLVTPLGADGEALPTARIRKTHRFVCPVCPQCKTGRSSPDGGEGGLDWFRCGNCDHAFPITKEK